MFLTCACSNGVEPDNQLYGMLIKAAGAAGDVDLALGLHDEMQREGLRPCTVSRQTGGGERGGGVQTEEVAER